MLSDLCPNCKYHTLYTTDDGQHMVCSKCRDVYDLTQGTITTVVLENKMKHLRNVMTNFFLQTLSETVIEQARKYVSDQIHIAKYGDGAGRTGKWRDVTFQRFEKEYSKWLLYILKFGPKTKSEEFELINRMHNKPLLTRDQTERISHLFEKYVLYLHSREIKLTVNYDWFFYQAFEVLNIDALVLKHSLTKARSETLMKLWAGFLKSDFFTQHFAYFAPPPSSIHCLYLDEFHGPKMTETFITQHKKRVERQPHLHSSKQEYPDLVVANEDSYVMGKIIYVFF